MLYALSSNSAVWKTIVKCQICCVVIFILQDMFEVFIYYTRTYLKFKLNIPKFRFNNCDCSSSYLFSWFISRVLYMDGICSTTVHQFLLDRYDMIFMMTYLLLYLYFFLQIIWFDWLGYVLDSLLTMLPQVCNFILACLLFLDFHLLLSWFASFNVSIVLLISRQETFTIALVNLTTI